MAPAVQFTKDKDSRSDSVVGAVRGARQVELELARTVPAVFNQMVLRDERTGKPILQSVPQNNWHSLANRHDRLLIWSHVESGKTNQLSIGRTLFAIGNDSSTRVAIISNTSSQAEKILYSISQYIEKSEVLHEIFPELLPHEPWNNSQLHVKRKVFSKDPTVAACGVHGNITGARIDLLILDDLLDYENSRTKRGRDDLWDWYESTLIGRLTENARVICVGTAWHPDDFMHRLAKTPSWKAFRYPVIDENGKSRWPDQWSEERIAAKRRELGPIQGPRQLDCIARDDSEARFKKEWLDIALKNGEGRALTFQLDILPYGCKVYTGVDLAVKKGDANDFTAMVTILVYQNGMREILNVARAKLSGIDILKQLFDIHRRYKSICVVENNAAQDYIVQFANEMGQFGQSQLGVIPIIPFTTGANKIHPEFGVESLATEMAMGKWSIPSSNGRVHASLEPLIDEICNYDPVTHTGDCLMAMWFAREGVRIGDIKVRAGYIDLMAR
jgi:hypothetical protein